MSDELNGEKFKKRIIESAWNMSFGVGREVGKYFSDRDIGDDEREFLLKVLNTFESGFQSGYDSVRHGLR